MKLKSGFIFIFLLLSALFLFGNNQQNQIVYVTATGQAYHLDGCTSLQRTQFAVSLIDAVKSGFRPCSRCRPPTISNPASIQRNTTPLYRVNVEGLTHSNAADIRRMLRADVVGHIDGDTIRVRIPNPPEGLSVIEVIRFIGVDAPETFHPTRGPEPFGQESSDFVRNALYGRTVYLAFDWDLRDRFGRLLAYIYTPDA